MVLKRRGVREAAAALAKLVRVDTVKPTKTGRRADSGPEGVLKEELKKLQLQGTEVARSRTCGAVQGAKGYHLCLANSGQP